MPFADRQGFTVRARTSARMSDFRRAQRPWVAPPAPPSTAPVILMTETPATASVPGMSPLARIEKWSRAYTAGPQNWPLHGRCVSIRVVTESGQSYDCTATMELWQHLDPAYRGKDHFPEPAHG